MVSLPAPPLTTSESLAGLGAGDRHLRRQSVDDDRRAAAGDADAVVAGRAVDDHGVRRAVALPAARRRRQVDGDLLHVGSGEVVDRDGVGAAQGSELDVLDAVEVHGDVADVAEQPHPLAIGRDVDVLGDVGAVEHQRIGAGLALDHVAAVARIPDERVVAVAEQRDVVAAAADHGVVAVAADQHVVAVAAGDGVVAGAAIDGEADDSGRKAGGSDDVVAAERVDDELVVGALGAGKRDRRRQAGDRDRASRSAHLNGVVAGGAVDGHAIGLRRRPRRCRVSLRGRSRPA